MDVKTWTTVSRLLDDALDLPAGARAAWVDDLSPQYDALKPRLRELLVQAAAMDTDAFLATLPKFSVDVGAGAAAGDEAAASRLGAAVGPYRLVRLLASGGQGSVWLAERPDGLLNRPVAIKLPHGLAFRPGLAERMARERDILASLSHPHIARLYDAGVSVEGEPYLALEYVDGTAIDAHASARALSIDARVRLFLQVVRAVAYAHGQLVIHRDLKPSNILVTTEGHPRLLDFGIAKLLGDEPVDSTLTAESGRAMTLAYASPEQVEQQPLGVATDVYSLGVVLFELLTGARPYVPVRESAAALEDAILGQEPRRASDLAPTPAVGRALRGDLDTILAKALKKAPPDRYPSAEAFADDLERYLSGRPVLARPDSRAYRLRKFVTRHRIGVAATAASLVAVLAGAGVAVWQAQVARAEQQRAEDVKSFIASLLQDTNPDAADARRVSVLDLLKRAEPRMAALPAGAVKAELLVVLGEGLLGLGDTDTVSEVAPRAVSEAALSRDPMLQMRANVLQAQAHFYRGEPAAMLADLDAAAAFLDRQPAGHARERATLWRLRADAYLRAARTDEAVEAARRSLATAEADPASDDRSRLAALLIVVEAEHQAKHVDAAVDAAKRALTLAAVVHHDNPAHPQAQRARALYADALADHGDLAAAADALAQAVTDAEQTFGQDGRTVGFRLQRLANLQIRLGRLDEAVASARRALVIGEHHAGAGSSTVAPFHNTLAMALLSARRGAEALPHFDAALETATRMFGAGHVNTLNARAARALALHLAGRSVEARREIAGVLETMRAEGAGPMVAPLLAAGTLARWDGAGDRAGPLLDEAAGLAEKTPLTLWQVLAQRGLLALEERRAAAAVRDLERALALADGLRVEGTPDVVDALEGLGRALSATGRAAEATAFTARAVRIRAARPGWPPVVAPSSRVGRH